MNKRTLEKKAEFIQKIIDLSVGCLANVAYYRSGWLEGRKLFGGEPYSEFNANCFFLVYLEWCKLFGNKSPERHHWCKLVTDKDKFKVGLLEALCYDTDAYDQFQKNMLKVRNKLIAHQDTYDQIAMQNFDPVLISVSYLQDYIYKNELDGIKIDYQHNPDENYEKFYRWGEAFWNGSTPADDPENKLVLRTIKIDAS